MSPAELLEDHPLLLGMTGLTAYFGMTDIGRPVESDAVVVTAAAGATGSIAGQIARIKGASQVIGTAGSPEKRDWVRDVAGFDDCVDHYADDVLRQLRAANRDGYQVVFDNVGGELLDACLFNIAERARVVLCGSISTGYKPQRPDVDHFNRDFKPELARGGTETCRLDPRDGRVTVLTHSDPPVWDFRASESPDGKYVAFCRAKTGGAPAVWVMDADGQNPRQVSREQRWWINSPTWSPDGQYIYARRHFVGERSLGAGEVWMFHVSGSDGVQVTERASIQKDAGEPALSPDGRTLYYSRDVSPGPNFDYNRDPYGVIYAIYARDLTTGRERTVTSRPGDVKVTVGMPK